MKRFDLSSITSDVTLSANPTPQELSAKKDVIAMRIIGFGKDLLEVLKKIVPKNLQERTTAINERINKTFGDLIESLQINIRDGTTAEASLEANDEVKNIILGLETVMQLLESVDISRQEILGQIRNLRNIIENARINIRDLTGDSKRARNGQEEMGMISRKKYEEAKISDAGGKIIKKEARLTNLDRLTSQILSSDLKNPESLKDLLRPLLECQIISQTEAKDITEFIDNPENAYKLTGLIRIDQPKTPGKQRSKNDTDRRTNRIIRNAFFAVFFSAIAAGGFAYNNTPERRLAKINALKGDDLLKYIQERYKTKTLEETKKAILERMSQAIRQMIMTDKTPAEKLKGKSYDFSIPLDTAFKNKVYTENTPLSRMGTGTVLRIRFDDSTPNTLSTYATIAMDFPELSFANDVVEIKLATMPIQRRMTDERPPITKEYLMKMYGSKTPEEAIDRFVKMTISDIETMMKTTPKPINPGDTFPFSNPFHDKNSPPNNFSAETAAGQARVMGISSGKAENGLTTYTIRYELTFKDFPGATTSRTVVFGK